MGKRVTLRCFIPLLCAIYFVTIYIFHGQLQYEISAADDDEALANSYFSSKTGIMKKGNLLHQRDLKRKVLQSAHSGQGSNDNWQLEDKLNSEPTSHPLFNVGEDVYDHKCFVPANLTKLTFIALEPSAFLHSAYLDERYDTKVIRIMSVMALEKRDRKLDVSCHFIVNGTHTIKHAFMYELCENHGKKYGGYMWTCNIPPSFTDFCHVNVSLNVLPIHPNYMPPETKTITMPITRLKPKRIMFKYSICVPPLFGNISTYKFIEFIELNRMFGVEHFIFYNFDITNNEILKLMNFYAKQNIVTLIDWKLPSVIRKNQIWYNGQLSAHNDCLYRAMSLTQYLAIIDIDEYLVPHNDKRTFHESFEDLFTADTCGLSFDSAFYDQKFTNLTGKKKTGLVTIDLTGRSKLFSKVRTKVMVQPTKIFEVGIHHISKPGTEDYKVLKVNTSIAYLHHYRTCVPNYGMKCGNSETDETLLPLADNLKKAVESVQAKVLPKPNDESEA